MDHSPNLSLPYLLPSQALKHITHNEALLLLDAHMHLAVVSRSVLSPPAGAASGLRYLIPVAATGAWSGGAGKLAIGRGGVWTIVPAPEGARCWVSDETVLLVRHDGEWLEIGGPGADSMVAARVGVNAVPAGSNRLAVASQSVLFDHEGGSTRVSVNKASSVDTASMLFQRAYTGHAEFGLAGSDDVALKVSADGSSWKQALVADRTSGRVSFPHGVAISGAPARVLGARKVDAFTTTSTTASPVGLSVSLTPLSVASTFVVRASVYVGADFWFTVPGLSVYRNGTKVWPQDPGVVMRHQMLADTAANSRLMSLQAAFEFEDAPLTGSALIYEVRLATSVSGYNAHVNRREFDATVKGESNLTVMELHG